MRVLFWMLFAAAMTVPLGAKPAGAPSTTGAQARRKTRRVPRLLRRIARLEPELALRISSAGIPSE